MPGAGHVQKKILLLLLGGVALGLSGSARNSFRVLRKIQKEWEDINEQQLKRSIRALYESKLVREKQNKDRTVTLILSEKGKRKALTYNIDEMQIKTPASWDGKWRIVLFDIPEKIKGSREVVRFYLKSLEFYEFQKSVFVHPFDCQDEIEYIIENFQLRKHVRFVRADFIDNELHLKKHFKLL
jgi:DNA-binding transcriptional regulator PaaX